MDFRGITLDLRIAAIAGLGGAIATLSSLGKLLEVPLLLAPFGASCVLVFGVPASPFACPRNVIGGYLVSASAGLAAVAVLGPDTAGIAIGVGLAIMAMMLSATIHPPAGAVPIVVGFSHPGLSFLLLPVAAGAALIVLIGMIYRWIPTRAARGRASRDEAVPAQPLEK